MQSESRTNNIEDLALKLFIRWMTGPDCDCPQPPPLEEDYVMDERGKYVRLKAGGYQAWYQESTCVDTIRYRIGTPFPKRLLRYCRIIAQEALS